MKILLAVFGALAALVAANDQCPENLQVKCVDDVRAAYEPCKKAAEGTNLPATLTCLKYYAKMKTDCWPCICMIAKQDGVHIQGCDQLSKFFK